VRDDHLRLLYELDVDLNRIEDVDLLLEEVLRGARRAVNADAGSIYLVEGEKLHFRYSQNDTLQSRLSPGEKLVYNIFSLGIDPSSIAGYCAHQGTAVNIPDAYHLAPELPFRFNPQFDRLSHYVTHSILCQPLKTNTGAVIGVLQLINARDVQGTIRTFTRDDELLVAHFSSSATLAVQRAQLTRTMILRMTKMAELRDPRETGPHVNRVAGYATEIYRRWAHRHGVPGHEADHLADVFRLAAMLHDVGKVGIDDAILKKPSRLEPAEYETMKTHTLIGTSLFHDPQSEFDIMAAEVTLSHHEHWNGGGYPQGLSGLGIPLWGRITAVADVYDALSCHRVYKPAWPEEEVLAEIRSQSGRQFDPEVVELFFEALPNLKQIFERYPDSPG